MKLNENWAVKIGVVVLILATSYPPVNAQEPNTPTALGILDQLAHVYHGVPVDRDFKEISLSNEAIAAGLKSYVVKFGGQVVGTPASKFRDAKRRLEQKQLLNPELELALTGAEAETITKNSKKLQASDYPWKINYFREMAKGGSQTATDVLDPELIKKIRLLLPRDRLSISTIDHWWVRDRIRVDSTYTRLCKAAGVPIPPDWNSGLWKQKIDNGVSSIPTNQLFLPLGDPVEVWTYGDNTTDGGCIALPRWGNNKTEVTLGVICQRALTGKACFWDNRPHSGSPNFTPAQLNTTSIKKDWVNGNDPGLIGGGKCTECHRGNNVFALHSDTILNRAMPFNVQASSTVAAASWYSPVTTLGWTNPGATFLPQISGSTSSGCQSCHLIAGISSGYCAMLRKAAETEMPSSANPAGWTTPGGGYETHIAFLKTKCGVSP